MKINALVIVPLDKKQKEHILQFKNEINFKFCTDNDVTVNDISKAEIIIGNPPVDLLDYSEKLKWIQLITAGADMYLKQNILKENVVVTNASGAYGEAQAEFMLAILLSLYKKLNNYRDNQLNCLWRDEGNEKMLSNSTAIMLGMGDIGTEFAKKLKAFGVYVIGVRRSDKKLSNYADETHTFHELEHIIHRADIIAMALPSSPQTRNLMSADMISKIRKGAVIINVGRGNTLDIEALCESIENNNLSGAALDVFEQEPFDKDHKLWKLKNIIITPHIAGHDFLPHTLNKTLIIIQNNLKAFLAGKALQNEVDRNIYEFK